MSPGLRVIAFFSLKGGCGKTTSCVNLAAALAEQGRRVLVVDLDANATASHTFIRGAGLNESIAAALLGHKPLQSVIQPTDVHNLWLAPACPELRTLEQRRDIHHPARVAEDGSLSDDALADELNRLTQPFDYILLDTPSGHTLLHKLTLLASDEIILPTGLSVYDLYATAPSLEFVILAQQIRKDRPSLLGFLPNGAGKRGVPNAIRLELEKYGLPYFSPVRHSALLKTMPNKRSVRQRLMVLARPNHPAAVRYRQIALEIELGIETAQQLAAALARPPDGLSPPSLHAGGRR